jgi:4-hydroxy-2-oxoheptanedioate aldolase
MINTRAEAEAFVGACRYPPLGYRSYGPNRAVQYAGADYWRHADREVLLLAQIETTTAVANVADILSVPGLDGVYVGPGDLSLSMGHTPSMAPQEPDVLAAMGDVLTAARSRGMIAAVHTDGAATARVRFAEGFNLCSLQTDMRMLRDAARSAVTAARTRT